MLDKPDSCRDCPLWQDGKGFVPADGTGANSVLIIGESAGYNEAVLGIPFAPSAQAGSVLHRVLQDKAKINRSEFAIHNLLSCRPYNDKLAGASYEFESVNKCRIHLDTTIKKYNPKVILALGNTPFRHLVGLQGKNLEIGKVRGYVFKSSRYENCLVVSSLHPSFIKRGNPHLTGVLLFDLMKAVGLAQGRAIRYILDPLEDTSLHYITNPSVIDAIAFLNNLKARNDRVIAYDIETDKSSGVDEDELEEDQGTVITQIQFSIAKDTGIALPWVEPFITISKSILALPNDKIGWNCYAFDNPILRQHGIEINGRVDDLMLEFHHYSADLPLGLQFVSSFYNHPFAWKHYSGSNLPFYGIADVSSLHYIYESLPKQLKERGLWDGYNRYVYNLWPILVRTSERGIPINTVKQEEFKKEIEIRQGEIEEILKDKIPETLIQYHPTKGYVREPKEVKGIIQQLLVDKGTLPTDDEVEIAASKVDIIKRMFPDIIEGNPIMANRWCKKKYFNPNSPDQVSNLIKYNGHEGIAKKLAIKIAKEQKDKEESKKENVSTSKNVLKGLALKTGDDVYSYIVEYKELTKMVGSFIDGWKPGSDGRIHPQFSFRPATGQLSARNPNSQQFPVHTTMATKMQETIEAEEGNVFCTFDYKGFHALMLGYLSGDENYMRLCRIDIHSYVTAHLVGFPEANICLDWDDDRLSKYLGVVKGQYKDIRDRRAKVTILGIGLGLSENGCYERYRDGFDPSPEEALAGKRKKYEGEALAKLISSIGRKRVKALYDLLRNLFPRVFKYQSEVIAKADIGYYDTPYGFRRWFNEASEVKYDRYGNFLSRTKGIEAEEAIAFPVQNNAHCHLREGILLLEEKGYLDKYRFCNTIHDSLVFETKQDSLEECIKDVKPILERESKTLKGFRCAVDVKVGKSIATLQEVR